MNELPKSVLYLSERNLRALLSKLERKKKGDDTACAIVKYQDKNSKYKNSSKAIRVVAITDEEAYTNREPGYMLELDVP